MSSRNKINAINIYLPEESKKMKNVIHKGGRFDVSTIDIHGFNELLNVCGLLKLQSIQVGFSHVQDAAYKTIEL